MADVLLIFVREDLAPATALAEQCEKAGYSIFTGSPLEAHSEDYSAAIVIWSESAESSLIFTESAARAIASGKALVASFAADPPPPTLADAPTFDLYDWDGEIDDTAFVSLFEALKRSVLGVAEAGAAAPAEPELILTQIAEPEVADAPSSRAELEASVLPELDQPEPDHPEQNLPELDPPDLEDPQLEEPKPPQLALTEPSLTKAEPPKLVLVDLEPEQEAVIEPDLAIASPEGLEAVHPSEPAPEAISEPDPSLDRVGGAEPANALSEAENFSPPLTEAPPGERRTRGKKLQRARRAPAARPAAEPRPQPTRDIWRDVAQATFLAAIVFVTMMGVGHWTMGATSRTAVAQAPAEPPLVQMAGLPTPAPAEAVALVESPAAVAPQTSVSPSPAPARRASSRLPRSGFVQASYTPDAAPEAETPVVEEPAPPPRQRVDLRRYRHGSKG